MDSSTNSEQIREDEKALAQLGYQQELARRMGGFSNLALSLSIICILAGGITSFHVGLCSVGGAAIGVGWPLACLCSLVVALTMAQVASAFPTAGGLYHWAAILGGRGWGWVTAWFNLLGLVTVLAAINVGMWQFVVGSFFPDEAKNQLLQLAAVSAITLSQALINHLGIRLTTRLTDFSGYWILFVSAVLTALLLASAESWDFMRLVTFANYSGLPPGNDAIWPATTSIPWLFALGLLLPAYTITGFDASAHVSEETVGAAVNVPRGIVRSVLVSGIAGWVMLAAIVITIPDMEEAARKGTQAFHWTVRSVLPGWQAQLLLAAIAVAQYLCGLATVTSASRMAFAFARDGGLPWSHFLRRVSSRFQTPHIAIWSVSIAAILFTTYSPAYATIAATCAILLYISYVLPTALGIWTYGRSWKKMGPWQLGIWYRPLAAVSVVACGGLIVIGVQPPNEKAAYVTGGLLAVLAILWVAVARTGFVGPPEALLRAEEERGERGER